MMDRLQRRQLNDATHLRQTGNPYDTTRKKKPQAHWHHNEADAIHKPHDNGVDKPAQPGSIPHNTYKRHCGPTITTPTSG